jgi:Domain of unknown function (DUF4440)
MNPLQIFGRTLLQILSKGKTIMKKTTITIALMVLFVSLAFGQEKMTVEQTLTKMEQEVADALVKGDTSVFDKYFDAKAAITDPGGMLMDKTQAAALLRSGDLKFESLKVEDVKVKLFGNTAIVTYRTTDKGIYKGQPINGQAQWTDTVVKMNGKWLIVATQGTPIMSQ